MLKNKKLIASCPTRWNSCFAMLKEFRDQKKVIMAIEGERRGFAANQAKRAKTDYIPESLPSLDMSDFELLRALCPIMEIFNKETEKETSSASTVISTLKRLRDFLQEQNFSNRVAPFVQILIRSLNDRLPELSHNTILKIAMLLDPRFAYSDLFPVETWKSIEQQFIEFAKEELLVVNSVENLEPVSFDLEEETLSGEAELSDHLSTSSDEKYDIWAKPKSPCTSTLPNTTISGEESADFVSKIESQLSQYKAWQRVPVDSDLFSWWRDNGKFIPEMAKIAQMLHCIPATSICSERLFSKAGLIYANTLRNRLSGRTVRQILVVKANLDKVILAPSNNNESDSESEDNDD
uniref:HAT C-terminal dimerisation domain-containing protein n=1 Tax=Meloidogyne enterolobii TaxID=390850 RepID=A0A6V7X5X6_MELEN|nr:unnamed protein product [Meloidogyne enterolobii]